ncbi:N-acetyltransferase 6 [Alligator sinensis]|uniref:N-alpha-acetyltransferase 80 n=1 Tax=Alligator sinensis TaxID=38654 RepID=A0A3Q0GPL4_ALLSI|nr:N-acetyltransferase 6 [Alligator sinensis]
MGSVSEMLTIVPLHQRPELMEACAELINEEWKKSKTSRIYSLQKSTDSFPLCLVLIKTQRTAEGATVGKMVETQLLGHARLSRVVGQPESLFMETVVVSKALRGKGYGRKLMEATERYVRSRGFRRLHLTTHDKQHFYAHLGYALSEPVQSMGFMSSLVPMRFLEMFSSPLHHARAPTPALTPGTPSPTAAQLNSRTSGAKPPSLPYAIAAAHLPPPPPPLSPPACFVTAAIPPPPWLPPPPPHASPLHTTSAALGLPAPPPPAPRLPLLAMQGSSACLPPPPLPLPSLSGYKGSSGHIASNPAAKETCGQMLLETPYRDLRGLPIFWMKKDI